MSDVIYVAGANYVLGNDAYLPTIQQEYGIHYQEELVGGRWYTLDFPNNRMWYFYQKGQKDPITWFNYNSNCAQLSNSNNYRYWSDFVSDHSSIMNGSGNITDAEKDYFNANVSWLWGSLDDGGAFITRACDEPITTQTLAYRVCLCVGLFEREPENPDYSSGKYYYHTILLGGGTRFTLAQMQHVGWFVYETYSYINNKPATLTGRTLMSGFFAGTNWYWGNAEFPLGTTTPENASGNTEWGILPTVPPIDQPITCWYWEGGSNNTQIDVNAFTIEHVIQLSGNMFSDDQYGSEPSGTGGNTTGGGYGSPSQDTGDVDGESADDLNLLTAINSGLCTLYNPTASELTAFAEFLYTGITDSIEAQLKKLLTNPLDYVLFVALAKFTPTVSGRQEISFAGIGSGVSSAKISNQFIEVDCGTVSYSEQFKSFLDYAPNSSVKLYLPFCSTVDLSVDDIMGSAINVNYLIDMLSGCCIARVKITRQVRSNAPNDSRVNDVIYEFQGNVYLTVPISATDWRGAYQSLVSLAGGVVGGITSGGVGGALAIASSVASSVTSSKVSVGRSGQAGSSYGYMNNKKPYLILERPIQSVPSGWGSFEGYMSNTKQKIGKLQGYTEIDAGTLWVDGFDGITSDEMDMLKQITSSGFYL